MDVVDLWPVALAVGVLWTLVVLVYDAARTRLGSVELWLRGAVLIAAAGLLSLALTGALPL